MASRAETATVALEVAGLTDTGRLREMNEDTWAHEARAGGAVLLVADGMGGHRTGEIASGLAAQALLEGLRALGGPPPDALARSFQRANLAVFQQAMRRSESRGMGTTLTAVVIDDQNLIVGHVGDSRAYLLRAGELRQLTRDHSWVAERVRQGILSEAEARTHRWRNVITNALGSYPQVRLDLFGLELEVDDTVLLCSDGLSGVLDDDQIGAILSMRDQEPAGLAAAALVELANDGGGPDNITVVLARVRSISRRPRAYELPRLGDEPSAPVGDPEPDATHTMVLEPVGQAAGAPAPRPAWTGWWLAPVALLYALVFLLILLGS